MRIERKRGGPWVNEHRSIFKFMRRTIEVHEDASDDVAGVLAQRRDAMGGLIDYEAKRDRELCVTGSGWSQSKLFHGLSSHVTTDADEGVWPVPDEAFLDGVENRQRYVLVTGGTKIHRLMDWLGKPGRDLSLRTAGSHKGQSVAGMVATGSHGSTLDETGCETHVRGMVVSTGKGEAVWLGDPDKPVLKDDWVASFATPGNPAHFAAARVHLGGMGFVSAYLIEAVEEFYRGLVKRARVLPADWADLVAQGRFSEAMGDITQGRTPHYYELTFDPFAADDEEVLETIWLDIETTTKPTLDAAPVSRTSFEALGEQAAKGVKQITENPLAPEMIEARLRDLIDVPGMIFDDFKEHACDERDVPRTLSQLTAQWEPHRLFGLRVDVYNAAFAVPLERLPEALRIAREMASGIEDNIRTFSKDFVYTVRFAKKSPAAMGFLKFEDNAIINIDGLPKNFLLGTDAHVAARRLQYLLKKAGIPFTMHWGKDAQMDAADIRDQYGSAVDAYRAARKALLGERDEVFISPALERWGLA
ncbi:FAD-binding protein [Qipengyuania seohaensis]|uniref:FAD-binding protein n=1 Tax=Qipengyuania seohaensis TaxID=266951 RepID=UPI000C2222F8|nr:FAD-binding protein [Qipengyuania seohaensis]